VGGEVIPKSGLRAHFKRGDIMTDGVNNNKPSSPASRAKGKTKTRRASRSKRESRFQRNLWHRDKKGVHEAFEKFFEKHPGFKNGLTEEDQDRALRSFENEMAWLYQGDSPDQRAKDYFLGYLERCSSESRKVPMNDDNPAELEDGDSAPKKAYKLANWIMSENRFYTPSEKSALWRYHEDIGTWKSKGHEIIHKAVVEQLSERYTTYIMNTVMSQIRGRTYSDDVTLGGPYHKIVLANGVYDLDTDEFSERFEPDEYHISAIPVKYDPEAKCPEFEMRLGQWLPDEDDQKAVIEFLGFCLFKSYFIQKFLILVGPGANGKSSLLNVLKAFVGNENMTALSLQQLTEHRFAPAQLHGKLANIAGDIPPRGIQNSGVLKLLTGEDPFGAEEKFQRGFSFTNYAKFVFAANQPPPIFDESDAFYRRLRVIEFRNVFRAGEKDTLTSDELKARLTTPEELSGILNRSLEGLKRLWEQQQFTGMKSVEETREAYRRISDPVQYFAHYFLEQEIDAEPIPKPVMYNYYCDLCRGLNKTAVNDAWFHKQLKRYVSYIGESQPRDGDRRIRVWHGVRVNLERLGREGIRAARVAQAEQGILISRGTSVDNSREGEGERKKHVPPVPMPEREVPEKLIQRLVDLREKVGWSSFDSRLEDNDMKTLSKKEWGEHHATL